MTSPGSSESLLSLAPTVRCLYRTGTDLGEAPTALGAAKVLVVGAAKATLTFYANIYQHERFETRIFESPTFSGLRNAYAEWKPGVIHFCAALRHSPTQGIFVEPVSRETGPGGSAGPENGEVFTPSAIKSVLASSHLDPQPLFILDAVGTASLAENVRQLLLRNAFAAELDEYRCTRAILAIGPGAPANQEMVCAAIASLVAQRGPGAICRAIQNLAVGVPRSRSLRRPWFNLVQAASDRFLPIVVPTWVAEKRRLENIIPFAGTAVFAQDPWSPAVAPPRSPGANDPPKP